MSTGTTLGSRRLLLAVLLPVLVLLAWVVRLEARRFQGQDVLLKVQAYDPRDLLAGHYLQYAVDYGSNPCELGLGQNSPDICVCLDRVSASVPATALWTGQCQERPNECATYIQGRCEYSRFTAGIERFYIPEAYTSQLTRVPPDSTIRVSVAADGSALVKDFLVGGVPLAQYVASPHTEQ